MMVLDDEARECDGAGGGAAALWVACGGGGGGEDAGDALSSSSGFAMRRPPSDCDRLRSPFMVGGTALGSAGG